MNKLILGSLTALALSVTLLAQDASTNPASQTTPQSSAQTATPTSGAVTAASGAQAAPSSVQASADQTLATANGLPPLEPQTKQGFWGKLNPFARKKYVNNQVAPVRDRTNELDELTQQNSTNLTNLDSRSKASIADAQGKADQANSTANSAKQQVGQTADQANQADTQVGTLQTQMQTIDQYSDAQSAEVSFGAGTIKLDSSAQSQLDDFAKQLDGQKGYVIEVTGYSNRKGQAGFTASQDMVDAVTRYLVLQHNVPLYRIHAAGLGDAQPPATSTDSTATATPASSATTSSRTTTGGSVQLKIEKNPVLSGSSTTGGSGQ